MRGYIIIMSGIRKRSEVVENRVDVPLSLTERCQHSSGMWARFELSKLLTSVSHCNSSILGALTFSSYFL